MRVVTSLDTVLPNAQPLGPDLDSRFDEFEGVGDGCGQASDQSAGHQHLASGRFPITSYL